MKKVLILFILSMVVTANAGLVIMVKHPGDLLWGEYAESKFTIHPSDTILVGVFTVNFDPLTDQGSHAMGLTNGLGSLDTSSIVTYLDVTAMAVAEEALGLQNPYISMEIPSITVPTEFGRLLTSVLFHCDGPGDVTFAVVDENGEILDTQVIHQIPEPMTLVLLGLGGLFLRRRIA